MNTIFADACAYMRVAHSASDFTYLYEDLPDVVFGVASII